MRAGERIIEDRARCGNAPLRVYYRAIPSPLSRKQEMKRVSRPFLAACLMVAAAPLLAAEGNSEAGKVKNSMCAGCHGIPMYRTAFPDVYSVPKLGGQNAAYIVKALQEYKAGNRTHPSMRAIAATLSDQDMADLAAYYASLPSQAAAK
jgi:cytochrome c553